MIWKADDGPSPPPPPPTDHVVDVIKGVVIATLSALTGGLVSLWIEELKEERRHRRERRRQRREEQRRGDHQPPQTPSGGATWV